MGELLFMKRKILLVIAIFIVLIAIALTYAKTKPSIEDQAFSFVNENKSALEDLSYQYLEGKSDTGYYKDAIVNGVYTNSKGESIVQYSYSGNGIGSATKYYGFYYSPNDTPAAFQNVDCPLEKQNDTWTWNESRTDNGGITKRITNCWYYYEAWL